ncbi:SpoIID/LytB domain protein [Moorena producens 3L]|uniref:SpoIID/LytB domain protein n=1 Tax=Moorena producens 3L TaxID=489825 RepID=F4XMM0_9CYAN|nr:SpoIID/LytB domain-containing protein [Moorena producens]EGJ33929.1 SpoIID/LytB domain protein [Moorena producens 3L]OLT64931.1 SpoIID/LytB domain-containing protein [Moorena producens 3L]
MKKSVLWSIALFSIALSVPLVLAKSLSPGSELETSSSTSSAPNSPDQVSPESDGLANNEETPTSELTSTATDPKPSQSPTPKDENSTASNSPPSPTLAQTKATQASTASNQGTKQATATTKDKSQDKSDKSAKTESSNHNNQPPSQSEAATKNQQPAAKPLNDAPILEMRVAVANGVKSLVVATSTPGELLDARGQPLGKLTANQGSNVKPLGDYIQIGNYKTPAGLWVKPTNGGYVLVGNRWYRGDLLLIYKGDSILAVNYVDLELYLTSVVGAEVYPSWPMAALKAQAIAARSYALVHAIRPASKFYDLGNTQRWQVYKGIKYEWNTTAQAVQETRGIFLSYKGGVVESLYAASDHIVKNVFGGQGMSQTGARDLAKQGYTYQEILGNYYPGTSLAWIDTVEADYD